MVTKLSKRSYFLLGPLVVFSLLPIVLGDNPPIMHLLVLCFIWSVVAEAWNLILGYARVLSFGQIAFFALGGYTSAMLTLNWGMSPWLGILLGGSVAAGVGFIIGLICLKLRGVYTAVVSFAVHLVLSVLVSVGAEVGTGGTYGLSGIPPLYIGGYTFSRLEMVPWYYVAFGVSALFLFVIYKIINSPVGLAFVALRDSQPFAQSLGIDDYRHMVMVFTISALITGIMGGFYVHYISIISPAIFRLEVFLFALVMVMLGGMGRFPGATFGAFVIVFLNNYLLRLATLRLVILGAIVVAVMIILPKGLAGIPETVNQLRRRTSKRMSFQ
jgi:branched-chain amino acid transport system permease protein